MPGWFIDLFIFEAICIHLYPFAVIFNKIFVDTLSVIHDVD